MNNAIALILSAALVATSLPGVAFAQDGDAADVEEMTPEERAHAVEQLATAGANAYRAEDFDTAIRAFKKAYAIEPVPNLLYNIAKAYERQEKYPEAVEYYQKFVVAPEVDSSARKAAMERIDSLREIAELKREQRDRERSRAETPEDSASVDRAPATPARPLNTTALWTIAGGVGLLGAGLGMGYVASSKADDIQDNNASYEARRDARDSAQTFGLVADGLFVASAVVTGVGLYLLFSDSDSDARAAAGDTRSHLTGWVTPQSAGLGMTLDF